MKIAILCPEYPPHPGGVADHCAKLAAELSRQNCKIKIFTSENSPTEQDSISFQTVSRPWDTKKIDKIIEHLKIWDPDYVLIQYVPYLYSPHFYGIQPLLPFWIKKIKSQTGCPVALIAHELHYPIGITPDRLLIGTSQFAQFLGLVLISDHVFFSYETPYQNYKKMIPWKKSSFSWLPVGANIEPSKEKFKLDLKIENKKFMLQFGGNHPTRLFDYTFQALEEANKKSHTELYFIGISNQEIQPLIEKSKFRHLHTHIHALGYLSADETSYYIQKSNLILAPFLDGISTRRGSVMAAFAHGKPVITTRGYFTDQSLDWEQFCMITDAKDPRLFSQTAAEVLFSPEKLKKLSEAALKKYQNSFSWPVIGIEIIQKLRGI